MTITSRVGGVFGALAVVAATVLAAPGASASGADTAAFPGFGLPFAPGQAVDSMGVHSDDGATGVKNAIDLTPNDGILRAPLGGTVHIWQCADGPWVTIDHAKGWRTGYYHMENIQVDEGQQVAPGTVLGTIGNALPCGGSSSGAHVHFTLWLLTARTDDPVLAGDWHGVSYGRLASDVAAVVGEPVNGKVFGGWRFFEAPQQYSGHTVRVRDGWVVPLPGTFRYEG